MNRRRLLRTGALSVLLLAAACSSGGKKGGATNTTGRGGSTRTTVSGGTATPSATSPPSITTVTGVSSITLPPVGVGKPAELARRLIATVTSIKAQNLVANGPGETSGPGVVVTIEIDNETDAPVDLNGLAVNAHYGHGIPAVPLFVPGQRLEGILGSHQRKSGRYEFHVARGQAGTVVIDIAQSNSPNVVIVDAAR